MSLLGGLDSNTHDELWVTNGTVAGTIELTNITSDQGIVGLGPNGITAFGTQALFYGTDSNGNEEFWNYNGSTAIELTTPPTVVGPYLDTNFPDITVLGKETLFNAEGADGVHNLRVTDGTLGGTSELKNIANASSGGLSPSDMMLL